MLSWFLLGFMLLGQEGDPYVIILTNNKRITAEQAPVCEGGLCKVTLLGGEVTSLPARMIDLEGTEAFNVELAERRRREAERVQEAARVEAEAAAREKPKTISLKKGESLPSYDRGSNSVSGAVAEGAVVDADVVGEPRERTFTSTDPVYLTREKITRYRDRYEIECELGTNLAGGAQNIRLQLKVNYADGLPDEIMKRTDSLTQNTPVTVRFTINRADEILQTGYIIDYETKE